MFRLIAAIALTLPAAAYAGEYRCHDKSWGSNEKKLTQFVQEKASEGWAFVTFAKPGILCFEHDSTAWTYECKQFKWKELPDIEKELAAQTSSGWQIIGFPMPGSLCMRRAGGPAPAAAVVPSKTQEAPTATAATAPAASPAKSKAAASPQGDVRDRANKLHEELKALEAKRASGQITEEEYEKQRREIEGS
jgi:hypothetical protein